MVVCFDFLKKKIDDCDLRLMAALKDRLKLESSLAKVKESEGISQQDIVNDKLIISNLIHMNSEIRPEFIEMLYMLILEEIHLKNRKDV